MKVANRTTYLVIADEKVEGDFESLEDAIVEALKWKDALIAKTVNWELEVNEL